MTKQKMMEKLANDTARAWYDMVLHKDIFCPRKSVADMLAYEENDKEYCRLRAVWFTLTNLLDAFGECGTPVADYYYEKAFEINSKVWRECKNAEKQ